MSAAAREDVERREHLAYAPEHGLYAVYRGAGGVALAAVMSVIGCAGAFAPWPSFELRPVACSVMVVGWVVWWWIVAIVAAKGAYRLTTDVLASVEIGLDREWRGIVRGGVVFAVFMSVLMLGFAMVSSGRGVPPVASVAEYLVRDAIPPPGRLISLAVIALAFPIWAVTPALVDLRVKSGLPPGRRAMFVASVLTGVGVFLQLGAQFGLLDWYWTAAVSLALICIAMLLLAWLAVGLRRRIAAILGVIARMEGEESGRGEVARVFSGEG